MKFIKHEEKLAQTPQSIEKLTAENNKLKAENEQLKAENAKTKATIDYMAMMSDVNLEDK